MPTAKLCLEALQDLVATAGESEGACPSSPTTSGSTLPAGSRREVADDLAASSGS